MPLLYFEIVVDGTCAVRISLNEKDPVETLVTSIIKQIKFTQNKMSYIYDKYTFYYFFPKPSFLVLTVSDENFERKQVFSFLEKLLKDIKSIDTDSGDGESIVFEKIDSKNLESFIKQKMNNFPKSEEKENDDEDVITLLKTNVNNNIDRIIAKEVVVDLLYTTEECNTEDYEVRRQRRQSRKRRRKWKNIKRVVAVVVVLIGLIYLVSAFTCGGFSYPYCKEKGCRRLFQ